VRLFRPTLRARMALLYGGLVLLVGVSLLFTCVILLDHAIATQRVFDPNQHIGYHTKHGFVPLDVNTEIADAQNNAISYLLHTGLIYFGIIVVIGTTGGYLLAKQALRPIARLTQTARALSTETLDQRISLGGPDDELRELADTFDEMLARLDAAFDSQRLFVANASHELRTPLTVIRTELDVTLADPRVDAAELRRMATVVRAATDRADALVDALLTLARTESAGVAAREPVDLAAVAESAVAAVGAEAAGRSLRVDVDCRPAHVLGDPALLDRVAGNLLENAVRHNVDGGWVQVSTASGPLGSSLQVSGSGAVVPPERVAELFEPFRRGAADRTGGGAGLGLSIVRAVVLAHGGSVYAEPVDGGGLSITVVLPAG
jgi:signal transduction histidine kinase